MQFQGLFQRRNGKWDCFWFSDFISKISFGDDDVSCGTVQSKSYQFASVISGEAVLQIVVLVQIVMNWRNVPY